MAAALFLGFAGQGQAIALREQLSEIRRRMAAGERRRGGGSLGVAIPNIQRRISQCPSSIGLDFLDDLYYLNQCIVMPPDVCCVARLDLSAGFNSGGLHGYEVDIHVTADPQGDDRKRLMTVRIGYVLNVSQVVGFAIPDRVLVPAGTYVRGTMDYQARE